ncbi:Uncharacterised protein [uncultured archaeon]|nr:Uncharacterised protein [uncultured archaeon]
MPNAYTHYVIWISRRKRHHGSASVDIVVPAPPPSVMTPGDIFQAPWAPPSISWTDDSGSHSANFAFWSITGGTNGALASTANTPPPVNVGNADIVAKAWYISGGNGPGEAGVLIDAFDVGLGDFVDDDFVTVVPDGSLTAEANNDGFVPTASLENINAYASIHTVPFSDWKVVVGTETVNNEDLQAKAQSTAIAFAFYQATSGVGPVLQPGRYAAGTWVSWGVMVDGGGPTGAGPVPPWNPYIRELAAGLALADAASKVSPRLRANVLDLAAKQVSIATDAIKKKMQATKNAESD